MSIDVGNSLFAEMYGMRIGVSRAPVRDTSVTYLPRASDAQATPRNLANFYKSNKMSIELGAVTRDGKHAAGIPFPRSFSIHYN